ncbi:hypothetical protein D3C86_1461590 [compost metagenome]
MNSMQIAQEARPNCLGLEARDIVTGLTGIITSYCQYLTGCTQVSISPKVGADGKVPETHWFDIQRVELTGEGVALQVGHSNTGGPQLTPSVGNGRHV